jgi:hypothetical protein
LAGVDALFLGCGGCRCFCNRSQSSLLLSRSPFITLRATNRSDTLSLSLRDKLAAILISLSCWSPLIWRKHSIAQKTLRGFCSCSSLSISTQRWTGTSLTTPRFSTNGKYSATDFELSRSIERNTFLSRSESLPILVASEEAGCCCQKKWGSPN